MPKMQGRYVITSVQLRPEQHERLARAVWEHQYDSVSDAVRRAVDLLMPASSDILNVTSSLSETEGAAPIAVPGE